MHQKTSYDEEEVIEYIRLQAALNPSLCLAGKGVLSLCKSTAKTAEPQVSQYWPVSGLML